MPSKKMTKEEYALWSNFNKVKNIDPDHEDYSKYIYYRNKLIEFYLPMLNEISLSMAQKIKELTADEISSYGLDGLIDAMHSFDPNKGARFKTWANIRIRGSIIDNIRKTDWVPRLVRQRNSQMQKIMDSLYSENADIQDSEIAKILDMSPEDFYAFKQKSTPITKVSINIKASDYDQEGEGEIGDTLSSEDKAHPLDNYIREEMYRKLLGKHFTKSERMIVRYHYYDGLTMKEIALKMGFSEGKVSQMHTSIINRLQNKVQRNPEYAESIQEILSQ